MNFSRRLFLSLIFTAGLFTQAAFAAEWGKDYSPVSPPQPVETGKNIEVLEIFYYGCPHCFHLEPIITPWIKHLPKDVTFRRMPGIFNDSWMPLAKAFYALESIKELDRLHGELFNAYHVQKIELKTDADIINWVAKQGVDRNKFTNAYNSFSVQNKALRAKQLTKAYGISGVPSVIVDGKFLTSASMTGSHEAMLPVLDQLIAQARQERATGKKKK